MDLKLIRHTFLPDCTHGRLFVDGVFFAHTLEDTFRDLQGDISKKVPAQTCIDPGTFPVIVSFSNRFKRELPELLNTPCFSKIRIHGGNTKADTEGCILIGEQSDNNGKIWNCAERVRSLTGMLKNKKNVTITVLNQAAQTVA